ncbi:hypothetical protein WN51_04704 [Melipona quadrifasciata]|uniref:Uncharacterized protein n=1 Tax=Melipona quadrifasciata TaxID=166423 RepID=A0A0M9ADD0_9HYME|nr:hypothetical protein WN51_04704 [Melipona quadrifasciata]
MYYFELCRLFWGADETAQPLTRRDQIVLTRLNFTHLDRNTNSEPPMRFYNFTKFQDYDKFIT